MSVISVARAGTGAGSAIANPVIARSAQRDEAISRRPRAMSCRRLLRFVRNDSEGMHDSEGMGIGYRIAVA
ncbi:MAG TPA: hypothetical protein VN681_11320 [Stellaceae bacterium]|nr:hypothetical protein [Stellaceae bacterium]